MSNSENLKNGFIRLHRSMLDWEWYDDTNVKVLFLHCLLRANYEDRQWRGKIIKRGQFITSQPKLAHSLKLSIMQIRNSLNKLKTTGEITVCTTANYSIITVKNYNYYQQDNSLNNAQMSQKQQSSNRLTTTNKEVIKKNNNNSFIVQKNETEKKEKENKIFKKPSLEEIKNYISEKSLNVDAESFFYYYETNGWKTGRNPMKSWQSALNFWNRNSKNGGKDETWSEYVDRMFEEIKQ